jgi:hypothetical protein
VTKSSENHLSGKSVNQDLCRFAPAVLKLKSLSARRLVLSRPIKRPEKSAKLDHGKFKTVLPCRHRVRLQHVAKVWHVISSRLHAHYCGCEGFLAASSLAHCCFFFSISFGDGG